MFDKPKRIVNEKVVQPIKDATAIAISALLLAILAIAIAVIR